MGHYESDGIGGWPFSDTCSTPGNDCVEGFGTSDNSAVNHRIYEFRIPLAMIGKVPGDTVGFAGISNAPPFGWPGIDDFDSGLWDTWPFTFPTPPTLDFYGDLVLSTGTDPLPTVEVWEPGGKIGQIYVQGDVINVTWNATDDSPRPLNPINITYGSGATWNPVVNNEVNDGNYSWNTTTASCPGTYWMNLSVFDSVGQTVFDESNYSFDLFCPGDSPPIIAVHEPGSTSDQTYTQKDLIDVTWRAIDDIVFLGNPINITYGNLSIGWTNISVNESNDGIYVWNTSGVICPGIYWMNMSVYDVSGQTTFDESNYSFNIDCIVDNPPAVDVWEPGGTSGQTYTQGDIIDITWNANDDNPLPPNPINITYGSGIVWAPLANDEANDGSHSWNTSTVPCPGIYWINASVYDTIGQTAYNYSNFSFDLFCPGDSPPVMSTYDPGSAPGQTYIQGDIINVTWYANDDNPLPMNPINITYGAGAVWTNVSMDEMNNGTYSWNTSGVACPITYWINISVHDQVGQTTFDKSNYSFDLLCPGTPPTIELWEPGGIIFQEYVQGDTVDTIWTASDDSSWPNGGNVVNISFGSGAVWTTIDNFEQEDGSYSWDTSGVPCSQTYYINISVYDSNGQTAFDLSNYSFNITCPVMSNGTIAGSVIDENDDPLEGAAVMLYDSSQTLMNTSTTDASGDFTFDVAPGIGYSLKATKTDYKEGTFDDVDITPSNTTNVEIMLEADATVHGKVIDENGNPIVDATVKLLDDSGNMVVATLTNSNGEYTLSGIIYGDYTIEASASGFVSSSSVATVDKDNLDVPVPDITLTAESQPPDDGLGSWWIILVILAIIIILIVVLLVWMRRKKPEAKLPPQPPKAAAPAACTKCGEKIMKGFRVCPICGTPTKPTACSKCGGELLEGFIVCPVCGNPVEPAAAPETPPQPRKTEPIRPPTPLPKAPEKPSPPPKAAPPAVTLTACSKCGAELFKGYTVCPVCGTPIKFNVCSKCGAELFKGFKVCPICGTPTEPASAP